MKNKLIIFLLSALSTSTYSQIRIGPKFNLGAGAFHSENLQKNLDAQRVADPKITQWDASSKLGMNGGLGVFFQYSLNDHIDLWAEMTFNWYGSGYKLTYIKDDKLINNKVVDISSSAKFKTSMLSIPLLFKYNFKGKEGPYALAGFRINFISKPQITSTETKTTTDLSKNKVTVDNFLTTATIDQFNTTSSSFVIGGGYSMNIMDKALYIDIRYNLPLSKSPLYTTNGYYNSSAGSSPDNNLFGFPQVANANATAPQYPLNDFRMGFIEFSAAYTLFKK